MDPRCNRAFTHVFVPVESLDSLTTPSEQRTRQEEVTASIRSRRGGLSWSRRKRKINADTATAAMRRKAKEEASSIHTDMAPTP
eukprot:330536-Hanusia_phi.AAC.3